ncbi:hypothetical protein JCM3774_002423 [Rhodotorula dairenensis]
MADLATDTTPTGFLTAWLAVLPRALSTLVGILLLLVSFGLVLAGAQLLELGTTWGRDRISRDAPGWLQGGVGGIVFGGVAGGTISAALLLLVLSYQEGPSLNRWATLAGLTLPAFGSALGGGHWRAAAVSCLILLTGVSLALLFACSAQMEALTPRLVVFIIAVALFLALICWRRAQRTAVPVATALTGAHLFVLAVDCFTRTGFIDATGLLVSVHGVHVEVVTEGRGSVVAWSSGKGKALIAGWWLLALSSAGWNIYRCRRARTEDAEYSNLSVLGTMGSAVPFRRGLHLTKPTLLDRIKLPTFHRDSPAPFEFRELPAERDLAPWDADQDSVLRSVTNFGRLYSPEPYVLAAGDAGGRQPFKPDSTAAGPAQISDADSIATEEATPDPRQSPLVPH